MPTTLTPTCPLCGLRYTDRPLLELHIREDHRPQDRHAEAEPDPRDPGDTASSPPGNRGWARTAPHRAVRALRYANDELMRAHEALSRERRVSSHGSDRVAGGGRA